MWSCHGFFSQPTSGTGGTTSGSIAIRSQLVHSGVGHLWGGAARSLSRLAARRRMSVARQVVDQCLGSPFAGTPVHQACTPPSLACCEPPHASATALTASSFFTSVASIYCPVRLPDRLGLVPGPQGTPLPSSMVLHSQHILGHPNDVSHAPRTLATRTFTLVLPSVHTSQTYNLTLLTVHA